MSLYWRFSFTILLLLRLLWSERCQYWFDILTFWAFASNKMQGANMCIFSNLFEILEILGATHTASVWPFQS